MVAPHSIGPNGPSSGSPSPVPATEKNVGNIFGRMVEDLEGSIKGMTQASVERARFTIENFKTISENLEELRKIEANDERTQKINKLTQGGMEDNPSFNTLVERINLFIKTYEEAKKKNDLLGFFGCFMKGDPCLSGRTESLNRYSTQLQIGVDVNAIPNPEKFLYLPGMLLSEHMYGFDTHHLTQEIFIKYVISNLATIASEFGAHDEESEGVKNFLEFLKDRKIYDGVSKVNWNELLSKLVEDKAFRIVYEFALNTTN